MVILCETSTKWNFNRRIFNLYKKIEPPEPKDCPFLNIFFFESVKFFMKGWFNLLQNFRSCQMGYCLHHKIKKLGSRHFGPSDRSFLSQIWEILIFWQKQTHHLARNAWNLIFLILWCSQKSIWQLQGFWSKLNQPFINNLSDPKNRW